MSYHQTWAYVSKISRWPLVGKPLCAAIQWGCGRISGHEPSKTEWGYGGGETADAWCRWCNTHLVVPKTSVMFGKDRETLKMMKEVSALAAFREES